MNTRQLMQGLTPTPEFQRQHTYASYRQFPELHKSKHQVETELKLAEGAKLTKTEFNTLLRRCLNINLKKMELDVLFDRMDDDRSGLIDGVEFIRYFFALGKEARDHIMQETMEAKAKRLEESRRQAREEEERIQKWQESQVTNFTPEDKASALQKLEEAAFRWDPSDQIEGKYVKGFEAFLTPYEFKVQIDQSFGIKLTGAETGALIQEFSVREGRHPVDGQLFIKKFGALHQKTKLADVELQNKLKRRRQKVLEKGQQVDYMPQMLGR